MQGVPVRVMDVVDVVAVSDRLVPASFAVFVRHSGVVFRVHAVRGHRRSSQAAQAAAASAARAFANAAMLCA